MKKKAQIQNMETITVVIIIIILIIFGIVYATNQRSISLERERIRMQDLRAMEIATQTLGMDFVKCSQSEAIREGCVDYYKIRALTNHTLKEENILFFYRVFGDADITVNILKNISFPNQDTEKIEIFKAPATENKSYITVTTPILVNDPIRTRNYFGLMEVKAYR